MSSWLSSWPPSFTLWELGNKLTPFHFLNVKRMEEYSVVTHILVLLCFETKERLIIKSFENWPLANTHRSQIVPSKSRDKEEWDGGKGAGAGGGRMLVYSPCVQNPLTVKRWIGKTVVLIPAVLWLLFSHISHVWVQHCLQRQLLTGEGVRMRAMLCMCVRCCAGEGGHVLLHDSSLRIDSHRNY